MSASARKVGLGLGGLFLIASGVFLFSRRPQGQSSQGPSREEVARFRGLDAAGHRQRVPPNMIPTPFPPPTPSVRAPYEPTFSPDGRYVACRQPSWPGRGSGELYVFDSRTGAWRTRAHTDDKVAVEMFWPLSNQLSLAGTWAQSWSVTRGHAVPEKLFKAPSQFAIPGQSSHAVPGSPAKKLENSPRASVLVTNVAPQHQLGVRLLTTHGDETDDSLLVESFDSKTGQRKALFQPVDYSPADVSPFLWSPTGRAHLLVSEFSDEFELKTSLWDANTGRMLWKNKFPGPNIHLEWTPNGRFIVATRVTGSLGRDPYPQHTSLVIDARNGRVIRKLKAQNSLLGTAVSNEYLASFGYEKKPGQNFYSRSWALTDLQSGKRVLRCWVKFSPQRVEDLALSANNRLIAGTSKRGMMLWKVADLKQGNDKPLVLSKALSLER